MLNSYILLGTIIMLLFAIGLIFLFLFYQNYIMKMRKRESEMLIKSTLLGERKERQRIAADLHDGVLGDLAATRNLLNILGNKLIEPEHKNQLLELEEVISETLLNTRAVCYNLIPPLLENHGLRLALMDYLEKLNNSTTVDFSLHFPESCLGFFNNENSYELYRILQEFTTNSIKYGNGTYFKINITCDHERIVIDLEDDAKAFGFFSLYKTSTGSGIKNIISRVQAIGAKLEQKNKDNGNHFLIYIPISK